MKNLLITITYVVLVSVLAGVSVAHGQGYPTRPLRMIVGFPPGGPTDLVARLVAQHLTDTLGFQVVTDNRPGAGGAVAGQLMAKAAPDGHTLFLASNGEIAISPNLYKKMAYEPMKDLAPVSRVGVGQLVMLVHPSVAAQSLKELIMLAKAKPGAISYGSSGVGSTGHLSVALFCAMAGVDMLHVPYKGAGPAMTDVMGGQVQLISTGYSSALPHIKSGKLRALGLTGVNRVKSNADLPTIAETLPGYQATSWYGVFVTTGTSESVIKRLYGEIAAMMKRPEVTERMGGLGIEPEGTTPQEFARQIREEHARWAKTIQVAKVPLQ
jgi:tripartite-type tricarboxylate transporter receptor subunit TctC